MTNQETLNIVTDKIKCFEEDLQIALDKNENASASEINQVLMELYTHRRILKRAVNSEKHGARQPWKIQRERFNQVINLKILA